MCVETTSHSARAKGATQEAHLFLIAAFCRLAKSLSHSEQMGWLVGAVGRTRQTLEFATTYIGRAAIDICHVALTKQLAPFEGQLPPCAASIIQKMLAHGNEIHSQGRGVQTRSTIEVASR